jgi:RHS repeat-associated protein
MEYDLQGRPKAKYGLNTSSDYFEYSGDGLTMTAYNTVSRDSVFYRPTGWVDSVVTRIGGRRFRSHYQPNTIGQLTGIQFGNDAGITFANKQFGWHAQIGSLDTIRVNGQITRITRNREGLPIQTIWPAVSRTHQWTAIHRPGEEAYNVSGINDVMFRRYSYDSRSNLRDRIQWENGNFRTNQSAYDGLRRQMTGNSNLFNPADCSWDFMSGYMCPQTLSPPQQPYDAGGNRMDAPNAWYGPGNRVTSFKNYQFAHDNDGNIIQKYNTSTGENKEFEWSAEGRLTRVLINGVERVRYDYNASGQLVRRSTNGMVDRHFLWDQGHLLAELDGSATQRIGEYAYIPGGADHPLALVTGAQTITSIRYMVQDEVGNVIGLMNGTGLDQVVSYDDWGVATISGSADNRLLFKGLLWEGTHTGLYYVRARWYDPELGRVISEDPQGINEGTNYYAFAASNALNGWDPSGQSWLSSGWRWLNKRTGGLAPAVLGFAVTAAAASVGIPLHTALWGTTKAFGAAAVGSFAAAGVESFASGNGSPQDVGRIFRRNFNAAGVTLGVFSMLGATIGGGIHSVGANSFQGFVTSNNAVFTPGGFTLGPATLISSSAQLPVLPHELRHTLQFIGLSAFGRGKGHQWWPYLIMGGLGALGHKCAASGDLITAGRWWEGPVGCIP